MIMHRADEGSLLLDPVPGAGIVSVCLAFPGPERFEEEGTFGWTGFGVELLRAGAGVLPEAEIASRFDEWGSGLSAFCTDSAAGLYYSCRPEVLYDSLDVLSRLMARVAVSRDLFERERQARIALIQEERDDPAADGLRRLRRRLFGEVAMGYSPLGRSENLEAASVDGMADFGEQSFGRGAGVLAVSGEFDTAGVGARAGTFPFRESSWEGHGSGLYPIKCDSKTETVRHSREQSVVVSGFRTGGVSDELALIRQLVLACLNGLSGPLFEEIRERHGLAYYSFARLVAGRDMGLIAFVSGCEEAKSQFLLDRLNEIIQRVGDSGFTEEEFESGRSQMKAGFLMNRQRTSWRAQRLAIRKMQGLAPDLGENSEIFLDRVRSGDAQQWCAHNLNPSQGTTLMLLPSPQKLKDTHNIDRHS